MDVGRGFRWGSGRDAGWEGERNGKEGRPHRPGPVYDTAMRVVLEGDPLAACHLLGIPVTTPSGVPEVLSAAFAYPVGALYADLVMRVGPGRLVHVEFERQLSAEEMVARMMGYRGVIQRRHRQEVLTQYLVVLGGGRASEFIDPVLTWFWRRLGVIFLRDVDPEVFLGGPALAPLAVLARGNSRARVRSLRRALLVIRAEGGDRAAELRMCAIALAGITLDLVTINRTVEEVEMLLEEYVAEMVWQMPVADKYRQRIREEVQREVRQEVQQELRQEVQQELRQEVLSALLQDRFGPHPEIEALAHRLATQLDDAAAVHAITSAADLPGLLGLRLPSA